MFLHLACHKSKLENKFASNASLNVFKLRGTSCKMVNKIRVQRVHKIFYVSRGIKMVGHVCKYFYFASLTLHYSCKHENFTLVTWKVLKFHMGRNLPHKVQYNTKILMVIIIHTEFWKRNIFTYQMIKYYNSLTLKLTI